MKTLLLLSFLIFAPAFAQDPAAPAATPVPPPVIVQPVVIQPNQFQQEAKEWITAVAGVLSFASLMLVPAVLKLWGQLQTISGKVDSIDDRQDRQSEKTGKMQDQIVQLALSTPPPPPPLKE